MVPTGVAIVAAGMVKQGFLPVLLHPHHLADQQHQQYTSGGGPLMTHKYRGRIVVLSINKSVKPNEEQKVLTSGFDQGFTVNTSKRVFRGIW
jgi:hypothetical protein